MKLAIARLSFLTLAFLVALPALSLAQEAPAPRKAPRTPVNRQTTYERRTDIPASRNLQGAAVAIDGERLRMEGTDLRLFGIVPPQLSASFGPQARMALDQIVAGKEVGCTIRDRSREGYLLATCRTAEVDDLALELLKRGLAVAARGSLAGTELIQPYLLAEQDAQTQHLGLWSISLAVSAQNVITASPNPIPANASQPPAPDAAKPQQATPTPSDHGKTEQSHPAAAKASVSATAPAAASVPAIPINPAGFFTRYQILIGNLVMLATALCVLSVFALRRRQDKRDELKAISAALRGELMAARAVCMARIKSIVSEQDDYDTTWPRLRSTLYHAYVSHIGKLGAELARKIASIYGQASDYALYYQPDDETSDANKMPKRHALATLVAHIEEVLPRLTAIEQSGDLAVAQRAVRARLGSASNIASATARRAAALASATDTSATQQHLRQQAESRLPPPQQQARYAQDEANAQPSAAPVAQEPYIGQEPPSPAAYAPAQPQQATIARSASVVTSIWESLRRFTQGRNAQSQAAAPPVYIEQSPGYEQPEDYSGYVYDEAAQQYVEDEQPQQPPPRTANNRGQHGA